MATIAYPPSKNPADRLRDLLNTRNRLIEPTDSMTASNAVIGLCDLCRDDLPRMNLDGLALLRDALEVVAEAVEERIGEIEAEIGGVR